jgi:hypothetical protein
MARKPPGWRPMITAFAIWFAHFMVIWAASEIWPHHAMANAVAWVATPIAWTALCVHWVHIRRRHVANDLSDWNHRFAAGAVAIATVAVLFSALPSLVFVP